MCYVAAIGGTKNDGLEELKFTQRTSELLSPEVFLADSMRLKISFHIIFTAPVTGIFVCLKLVDKDVYLKHTKIL